jgi:hypothetical protein
MLLTGVESSLPPHFFEEDKDVGPKLPRIGTRSPTSCFRNVPWLSWPVHVVWLLSYLHWVLPKNPNVYSSHGLDCLILVR